MTDSLPLEMLQPGDVAVVDELVGLPDAVVRLEELGLRVGEKVEMVQSGSPCIIRIAGHKLCFREGEAFGVMVRAGSGA